MLLERKDVHTAPPDNENQTPLSLAFSKGHDGVVRILLESDNVNSDTANSSGQASTLPSTGDMDLSVVEMKFRGHDLDIDISGHNGQPTPPPAGHNEREVVLGSKDSIPDSGDSDLSSTKPSKQSQSPSLYPLKSPYPLGKVSTHPRTTRSPLSFAADQPFIISSLICLFAFLYLLPSSSWDILPFRKYLSSEGLV